MQRSEYDEELGAAGGDAYALANETACKWSARAAAGALSGVRLHCDNAHLHTLQRLRLALDNGARLPLLLHAIVCCKWPLAMEFQKELITRQYIEFCL